MGSELCIKVNHHIIKCLVRYEESRESHRKKIILTLSKLSEETNFGLYEYDQTRSK